MRISDWSSDVCSSDLAALTPAMRAQRGYKDNENWDEPMLNVFRKDENTIRHFWGSELVFTPEDPAQDHRGLDFADAVWGLLDTTPEGRGDTFFPKIAYGQENAGEGSRLIGTTGDRRWPMPKTSIRPPD